MEVKRIFFKDGGSIPYYELSNGDIKKPRANSYGAMRWYTDEEYAKYKEDNKDEFEEIRENLESWKPWTKIKQFFKF